MIAHLKARLPKGRYGKNIAKLATGTAVGQAIAILAAPVLTRLYSPGDFGVLAVYASVLGIIGSIASLNYHQAIPLPETNGEAANLFGLSLLAMSVTVGLTFVGVGIAGSDIAGLLGVPELSPYLWLIPVGVLGLAFYEVVNQWALRQKAFSAIAKTTVAKGVVQTGAQLSYGFLATGPFGLLLGQLLGQWVGAGRLFYSAMKENGDVFRGITITNMRVAATRHSKFLKFTTPSVLLNAAGRNTPVIILSYFFGVAVAGLFALGERVLMIPVTLLAKNASQVFVASAAEFNRVGRLAEEVEYLFERMLRISLAPVIILGLASPVLFAVIFGEQWAEAGHYVRWLSPWLLFVFISFALMPVILVLERQKEGMWFQGLLAIGRVGALVVGGIFGTAMLAIAAFGLVSGFLWAIYLIWILLMSGVAIGNVVRIFAIQTIVSIPFAIPVAVCMILGANELLTVGVVAICIFSLLAWQFIKDSDATQRSN